MAELFGLSEMQPWFIGIIIPSALFLQLIITSFISNTLFQGWAVSEHDF